MTDNIRKRYNITKEDQEYLNKRLTTRMKEILKTVFDKRKKDGVKIDLNDSNWLIKRAHYDGKLSELDFVTSLLFEE